MINTFLLYNRPRTNSIKAWSPLLGHGLSRQQEKWKLEVETNGQPKPVNNAQPVNLTFYTLEIIKITQSQITKNYSVPRTGGGGKMRRKEVSRSVSDVCVVGFQEREED